MAKTVYDGFQELLTRLAPSETEVEKRKSHKRTADFCIPTSSSPPVALGDAIEVEIE